MEENNEYGNCWQDLMRRVDAENRVADAIIGGWQMLEEDVGEEDNAAEGKEREDFIRHEKENDDNLGKRKEGSKARRTNMKEKTGEEIRVIMVETNDKNRLKSATLEARKMVKRGKMKTIHAYFKGINSKEE